MEEKTDLEKRAVELVTKQIINMLTNNILEDNGTESFEGWCEDGGVFYYSTCLPKEAEAATELMKKVAPIVDRLTYEHLNFGY